MNNKKSLTILGELPQTELDSLPAPFSVDDLKYLRSKRGYPEEPNLKHSYVKDGIAVKGLDFTKPENFALLKTILNATFTAINSVKDEHFKELGLLSAGFLRFMDLGFSEKACAPEIKMQSTCEGACKKKLNLEANLYMRFTTDMCPAGIRMMDKAKSILTQVLIDLLKCQADCVQVNFIHGGSAWELEDVLDETQREILTAILKLIDEHASSTSHSAFAH